MERPKMHKLLNIIVVRACLHYKCHSQQLRDTSSVCNTDGNKHKNEISFEMYKFLKMFKKVGG